MSFRRAEVSRTIIRWKERLCVSTNERYVFLATFSGTACKQKQEEYSTLENAVLIDSVGLAATNTI
jgi:hypothetical protein